MAIESATFLRRLARTVTLVLIVACLGAVSAAAQAPVMVGSVVPNQNASNAYGQIYRICVAKNGNILFLDAQEGALYQLAPGATTLTTLSAPGAVLKGGGNFWNAGMALDNNDTLYIGSEWNTPYFYRVPYTPGPNGTNGTWNLTGSSDWTVGDQIVGGSGSREIAFDDSNNMYVSTESAPEIIKFSVDANGNAGPVTTLVKSLTAEAAKMTVDHAGNVFFIEDPWEARDKVAVGVWMVPAGTSGTVGEVAPVVRIDPPALAYEFKGVSVDAAGNLYLSSTLDTGGTSGGDGNANMVLMVPNESGSPTTATQASINWNHAVMVAPVTATAAVAIDPRGYLWIPTNTNGWVPPGTTLKNMPPLPGTNNWVQYSLGSINLGSSPIGTAGATGTLFFTFSGTASTTPAKIVLSQPGGGSDFTVVTTNPLLDPNTTPPSVDTTVIPCAAGTPNLPYTTCQYWLAVNPRVAGPVSGQVQMLDTNNDVIGKSAAYLYGVGQGPEVSILGSPAVLPIGNGFSTPEQVAVDSLGNTYVADPGQGMVLQYPAGSTSATVPVPVGTGLIAPTGVAVDGAGNVYIGDSGKVIEVPYVAGALDAAAQTVLQSGLGSALNLAVDGAGNVYAADPSKAQVVKVSNSTTQSTLFSGSTISLDSGYALGGFTKPTAVAVDGFGDVFVADETGGSTSSLDEVTPTGLQSSITTDMAGTVSGLAVDASGSVYITGSAGLTRIPAVAGTLSVNDAVGIGLGTVNSPTGLALDRTGNLYASYVGASSTPTVAELSVKGSFAYGTVTPYIETDADVQLFNIGNSSLTLSALAGDLYSGANAADFSIVTAGDTPVCDPTAPIAAAMGCYFGFGVVPSLSTGTETASVAILSNATNAPSVALAISANPVVDTRPATTTTISPIAALTYPGNATITVTVASAAGTPAGTVQLKLSGHGVQTAQLSNGVATFTYSNLLGGSYNVNATYEGYGTFGNAPDFAVSVAPKVTFTVNPAAPTVTVSTPATYVLHSGSYTITANVSSGVGVPTGTVSFMNGANLADPAQGPITISGLGNATFNTSNLPLGTYTLTAVYSGDQNYAPATVTIGTFQIINQSVLITATPAALSVTAGVPGQVSLNLQGLVGFGGSKSAVVLGCVSSTLPQYSECTFDNTTILITPSGGSATVVMTISTNVPVNGGNAALRSGPAPWALAGIFGFGLFGLAFRRKTRFNVRAVTIICLALLLTSAMFGVTSCTNNGYTHTPPAPVVKTPSGTSNVVVTTTWNGALVSLPFTLPVTVK
jgi:hypothetical protein